MISRSNWAKLKRTFRTSRPIEVAVLNCRVTDTKETCLTSNAAISWVKSSRLRLSRSTLYTTTQSTRPASTSASRRFSAGRSALPPVNPPSSYRSGDRAHPAARWLATYAAPASNWTSRLLNSCSSPSSVDCRV